MNAFKADICFGSFGDGLYLAIDGEATRHTSQAAERLVSDYLTANRNSANIVLDLGSASYVDSTFAGWMLKLRRQMGALPSASLCLSGCSDRCRQALDNLHVTSLIQRTDVPKPDKTTKMSCSSGDLPERALLELMAAAHEELASLDEQNRQVFGPIAEALRKGLQEERHRPPQPRLRP